MLCMNYKNAAIRKKLVIQKELILIKEVHQKNLCFVIIGILKMLGLNLNRMFVTNVMMFNDCL